MKTILKTFPRLALRLSQNYLHAVSLFFKLTYFYISRKVFNIKQPFRVNLSYLGTNFSFDFIYAEDVAVLEQLYLDNEYEECPIENPSIILDLGAHFGDSALYYHARFPDAKIIAVEPSPESYSRLLNHTKSIEKITCLNAAIGSSDGTIELNIIANSLGNSVKSRDGIRETVAVPQLSLRSVLKNNNIERADIIKFDIEGAESEMFGSIKAATAGIFYIGESHPDLMETDEESFFSEFNGATFSTKPVGHKGRKVISALFPS